MKKMDLEVMNISSRSRDGRAQRKVAVIGSGISGLSAAWLLDKSCDVTLYESNHRPGGHANTVDVEPAGKAPIAVDTGFIVYNEKNYPILWLCLRISACRRLPPTCPLQHRLAAERLNIQLRLAGLIGQKSNLFRPRFWKMVRDIMRFYKVAPDLLKDESLRGVSLGAYLDRNNYSAGFIDDHLLPMGAAIWSMTANDMRDYPLHAFIRFFVNHGLVQLSGRPQWRTVKGGSREYVSRVLAEFRGTVRLSSPVAAIRRTPEGVTVVDRAGDVSVFDDVVIATHADDALSLLADADDHEQALLGAFEYTNNTAVLHSDERLMRSARRLVQLELSERAGIARYGGALRHLLDEQAPAYRSCNAALRHAQPLPRRRSGQGDPELRLHPPTFRYQGDGSTEEPVVATGPPQHLVLRRAFRQRLP